jgi:hypothetical protein
MTRVDHHAHHKLVSSWQPSSQYHMRLREAKGAINVTWCPHGGLRRSIICYYTNAKRGDPRRKLDMPLDGYAQGSHQRCAWQTLRRCRLQHICEHSGQVLVPVELAYPPQLARNSSCIDQHHWSRSRERILLFTVAMWLTTAPLSSALLREAVSSFHEGRLRLEPANSSRSARSSLRTRF